MLGTGVFTAFLLFGTFLGIGPFNDASWQSTFCKIAIFGIADLIECDNMKDTLTFRAGDGITMTMNKTSDTVLFRANFTSLALEDLSNVTDNGCASGQIRQVNGSGWWVCVTPSSGGEANTGSNVGSGEASIFKQKSGIDLQFKKLKQGSNVVLTNGTDEITIAVSGVGTGNATMFNDLGDVSLSGVASGHIVQVVNGYWQNKLFKSNTINCTGNDKISSYDNATGTFSCTSDNGGTDTNTAQIGNAGTGESVFGTRINATQNNLKTFRAGTGVTLSSNSTDITITATITDTDTDTNTAQIVSAGGTSLFKQRDNATQNTIKGLTTNRGITLTPNTNDVQVDTNFKIDTLSTIETDRFISAFDNATGDWTTKIFSINSITSTCSGTDKVSAFSIDNSTGFVTVTCSTDQTGTGGGFTKINNVGSGTIKLVQTNSSSTANIKSLASGQGITLSNGTTSGTIATSFKIDTQSATNDYQLVGFDNTTGDFTRNQFSVNTQTCPASQFVNSITNTTGFVSCSSVSGLPVVLGGNLTTTSSAAFTTIFTVPLKANSGNIVDGILIADTGTAGIAVQTGARLSALTQTGWCNWITPTTASATAIDNLVLATTTAETAESVWLPAINTPQMIKFTCVTKGSGTPNLLIAFQAESGVNTVNIRAGSFYVKQP